MDHDQTRWIRPNTKINVFLKNFEVGDGTPTGGKKKIQKEIDFLAIDVIVETLFYCTIF